jgi:TctA family transporter
MKVNFYEFIVKLCQVFINDKILVIVAVTGLCGASIVKGLPSTDTIVTSAFTGLFGIAVGMSMKRSGDIPNGTPPINRKEEI